MSNIAIKGNASGTGTFTVEAPNSNTDRTLVLPDEAGTVVTTGGTGSVTADMLNSTLDLSGKTVTLPSGVGGKVLQVLFNTSNTASSTSTQANYLTAVSQTITLSSTSSKLLILARIPFRIDRNGANTGWASAKIQVNSVNVAPTPVDNFEHGINFGDTNWSDFRQVTVVNSLHSPNSTSVLTVTAQMAPYSSTTLVINEGGSYTSSIILMEIAG